MLAARILVADDERETRAALADVLLRAGYRVTTVSSGEETLREVQRSGCYHLVILDYCLGAGGRSGGATGLELVPICPNMPVIIISGYPEIDLPEKWILLPKPWSNAKLLKAVEALLREPP